MITIKSVEAGLHMSCNVCGSFIGEGRTVEEGGMIVIAKDLDLKTLTYSTKYHPNMSNSISICKNCRLDLGTLLR